MDERDLVTIKDSLNNDNLDPVFVDEFTPIASKEPETEQKEEDEYVTKLLARENGHHLQLGGSDTASIHGARLHFIQWLMKSRPRLELGYRTAYLSIMYFDRFLSLQSTNLMRLVMVACLSLAVKMEEVKTLNVSAYGGGGGGGGSDHHKEFSFGLKRITRMELRVLNALQWEMRFISPFPFISFFLRYLSFHPLFHIPFEKAFSRTAFIVFQAATVISTMNYKPSVMAMAAALLVIDSSLSKAALEAKIGSSAVSSYGFDATAEQVHLCYETIMKQVLLDDKALSLVNSSWLRSSSSSSFDVCPKRMKVNGN